MTKKKLYLLVTGVILVTIAFGISYFFFKRKPEIKPTVGVTIVPTMQDDITGDSSWCATFQLVWNDMKNEVVHGDILFDPQVTYAENLNKEEFTSQMLNDDYYYKTYGLKTLDLKEKIIQDLKTKFNQKSDILDKFDWSAPALDDGDMTDVDRYFFYTMLYREFNFNHKFSKLKNANFGKYENIKYFGIDSKTKDIVGEQIEILFYNSKDEFAILINTKNNDEVIFYKNPEGNTFKEIYENMLAKAASYTETKSFRDTDEFKAPYLSLNIQKEYTEFENKLFATSRGMGKIEQAIQSIQFTLDETGGKIKSEAGIDVKNYISKAVEPRYFYVDDTFAIFLKEKDKDLPYFASKITDITKYQ